MSIAKVAFIGAGSMGAPMAMRVKEAGYQLTVCDPNSDVVDRFRSVGANIANTAAECAAADVVIVLVANDEQIFDATIGPKGILHGIPSGHSPVVCIMCTTHPETIKRVAGPLVAAGARVMDAPISGGIVGAQKGTLTILMGGEREDCELVSPLMRVMGKNVFECGDLGSAEVVKVANNAICIAVQFLTAEVMDLAERQGVSFEKLAPILNVSSGRNFLTVDAEEGRHQYAAWARSPDAFGSLMKILAKDLHLAENLAASAGLQLNLLSRIADYADYVDSGTFERWQRHGKLP
ncbi:NAD(P)-dependent oxidoreductase [Xanthobacter aminoxidans]|uniref:NAD(P)-dependent oxidoreductase n=1 Tax=Xanthobacter aminoxidans TaxID=186280 RepID=UPI002022D16E|nr:NAD(P)-dependent oxidoreductase [Xanthobacter aminoxidans]MCL8385422.1 NAD(P)-dependent oxidoreductase [Xanthobacter aminoxidans]